MVVWNGGVGDDCSKKRGCSAGGGRQGRAGRGRQAGRQAGRAVVVVWSFAAVPVGSIIVAGARVELARRQQ